MCSLRCAPVVQSRGLNMHAAPDVRSDGSVLVPASIRCRSQRAVARPSASPGPRCPRLVARGHALCSIADQRGKIHADCDTLQEPARINAAVSGRQSSQAERYEASRLKRPIVRRTRHTCCREWRVSSDVHRSVPIAQACQTGATIRILWSALHGGTGSVPRTIFQKGQGSLVFPYPLEIVRCNVLQTRQVAVVP